MRYKPVTTHSHQKQAPRLRPLALTISALLLGGTCSGAASAANFPATVNLSSLNGSNGFRLDGVAAYDQSGRSVSAAGDINGDGLGDLIIGAFGADPNGNYSGSSYVIYGQSTGFTATVALASLDGSNGFRLDGEAASHASGGSVSAAGDINGDGLGDLIVGASGAAPNGTNSGSSYVIYGRSTGFAATLALSGLDGSNGFRVDGEAANHSSGGSVSAAGDINGDGLDDLIVGASGAAPNGANSGSSYVVYGRNTPFAATLDLASLNGINGFRLDGVASYDGSGFSVSAAGDINGDGLDDLIVGAIGADPNGVYSGSSYVVYGRSTPFAATLDLSSLNGTNGFRLDGVAARDGSGYSVSAAGDINDDGLGDLIVGAYNADPNGNREAGSSYVVYGRSTAFAATLALASLDGSNGFRLDGVAQGDRSGRSVSAAGDINGDGIGDLIVGAYSADPNGSYSGSSYVIYGQSTGFAATVALASLDGSNGFRLDGVATNNRAGSSLSAAGDINGDGLDDLVVGARLADPNGSPSGSSYVIYGQLPAVIGIAEVMQVPALDRLGLLLMALLMASLGAMGVRARS